MVSAMTIHGRLASAMRVTLKQGLWQLYQAIGFAHSSADFAAAERGGSNSRSGRVLRYSSALATVHIVNA
jgi:hypothetical protein